ncbi:hypothetical protein HLB25_20830 [Dickeya dadantii]|uniref:hypothetical protein n=1 Tax=Dickeya dadantii TaxID=204038 RepID=UPI0014959DC4|nr:hypothetical protein [Dickeya dadantii]NPE68968.1 hypothetical protein [Dickeya dadantii]
MKKNIADCSPRTGTYRRLNAGLRRSACGPPFFTGTYRRLSAGLRRSVCGPPFFTGTYRRLNTGLYPFPIGGDLFRFTLHFVTTAKSKKKIKNN